ncbi:MAG: flagellar basal body P-ring formation protein FlgA [Candidatus Margulisbacteria bacterium]|nr:flagellar basal body P-ring formation protein FlgA [Candidatus Margulisiibacteriota bacterium]
MELIGSQELQKTLEKIVIQHTILSMPQLTTSDIQVSFQNAKRLVAIPKNATYFTFKIPKKALVIGSTVLPCTLYDDKKISLNEIQLQFSVEIMGNIIRNTAVLIKGAKITTENIEVVYKNIRTEPRNHYLVLDQVIGKEVSYTLAKGTTLIPRMLHQSSLIKAGDIVYISMNRQGLEIQIKGKAMEGGAKGDRIRVTTLLEGHKVIQGEIVDEQHIKLSGY